MNTAKTQGRTMASTVIANVGDRSASFEQAATSCIVESFSVGEVRRVGRVSMTHRFAERPTMSIAA